MADLQNFADWLYDNGHLKTDPDELVKQYESKTQSDPVHPSGEPYCYIPNCRNKATQFGIFCREHNF